MTSAISGIVTLLFTTGMVVIHFMSGGSTYHGHGCQSTEVFRSSDRSCYTPQGE